MSSPLMFHWSKQDMWPNPRPTGKGIKSLHGVGGMKVCSTMNSKHSQVLDIGAGKTQKLEQTKVWNTLK